MKVLHFPYTYFPDAAGGTEVYVKALCRELRAYDVENVVVAPGPHTAAYQIDGQRVIRYPTSARLSLQDLYGEGDQAAAQQATQVIAQEKPDIVQFHAYTSGVSLLLAREVKRRGIPFVLTYHTPTVSCMRGTLLYMGREICDGVVEPQRCTACLLESKGVPAWASGIMGRLASWVPTGEREGGVWTAARLPELAVRRAACFAEMMRLADRVVAVCDWVAEVLRHNGVDPAKVLVSRQGAPTITARRPTKVITDEIKLIYLGRIDPTKGLHIALEALAGLPGKLSLDIYGVIQGESTYLSEIRRLIAAREGVRLMPPTQPEEVVNTIANYDALVVPSTWLETGPLVVYEAFAAGVPVIGSRLGGIAELVAHERDGILVAAGNVPAWQAAFRRIVSDRSLLARLGQGISEPRTMASAAAEMNHLYRQVLEPAAA